MYKDLGLSATAFKVLIVKTSSLGDIIQSFPVLSFLHKKFPNVSIDWIVEEPFSSVVQAHPLVHQVLSIDTKGLKKQCFDSKSWRRLMESLQKIRVEKYNLVVDLQGNCKSGFLTGISQGEKKIGFGLRSVREWPNVFFTDVRFEVLKERNIRAQYLSLLKQYFSDNDPYLVDGVRLKINLKQTEKVESLLVGSVGSKKMMVCPGSQWMNKKLPIETWIAFLKRVEASLDAFLFLMWGTEEEKRDCALIHRAFEQKSVLVERLDLATWQNLMSEMDLVMGVDSSAIHLCGTTSTPSFSLFGPTNSAIFKPIGAHHFAYQGSCPYGKVFKKTCPILRSCPSGACIRGLSEEAIYQAFMEWWETVSKRVSKSMCSSTT